MRLRVLAAAAVLSLAAAGALVLPPGDATLAQSTVTVPVGDLYFCDPSFQNGVCETTVTQGDTVEWQFVGGQLHTTTACSDDLDNCSPPHLWDSPAATSGSFSFTFDTPGTYLYRCQVHPVEMRGRVVVAAATQPTPTPQPSATATAPAATPTPAVRASAVPSGGSAPPVDGSAGSLFWIAILGGTVLAASAAALVLAGSRRRGA